MGKRSVYVFAMWATDFIGILNLEQKDLEQLLHKVNIENKRSKIGDINRDLVII